MRWARDDLPGALAALGCDHALVVSSADGLDEMSTSAPTHVVEVRGNELRRYDVTPEDAGITPGPPDAGTGPLRTKWPTDALTAAIPDRAR